MSIEKEYGEFQIVCDDCGYYVPGFDRFSEALDYCGDEGWKAFKVKDEWNHFCPVCSHRK